MINNFRDFNESNGNIFDIRKKEQRTIVLKVGDQVTIPHGLEFLRYFDLIFLSFDKTSISIVTHKQ